TFHQWHGGISKNTTPEQQALNWLRWSKDYSAVRGKPYMVPELKAPPVYIGTLPQPALARFVRAALHPARREDHDPLGADFNRMLWSRRILEASEATVSSLVQMARDHFA